MSVNPCCGHIITWWSTRSSVRTTFFCPLVPHIHHCRSIMSLQAQMPRFVIPYDKPCSRRQTILPRLNSFQLSWYSAFTRPGYFSRFHFILKLCSEWTRHYSEPTGNTKEINVISRTYSCMAHWSKHLQSLILSGHFLWMLHFSQTLVYFSSI